MKITFLSLHRFLLSSIFAFLLGFGLHVQQANADTASVANEEAIKALVLDTIRENPEIIVEAMQVLRDREEAAKQAQAKAALTSLSDDLFKNAADPVAGNPKGDITIVEFFDYRCGYCKRVLPEIQKLLDEDKNIRLVLKEFPILGPESVVGAQAALAVWQIAPEKYWAFHEVLMAGGGAITKEKVLAIAKENGIAAADLEEKMSEPAIMAEIEKNRGLAQALGISGTPAFVIGDQIVPGAIGLDDFKSIIAEARKG